MQAIEPFAISDPALVRIREMLAQYRKQFGKDAIPAIMWIDERNNRHVDIESLPAIGFYDNPDDIKAGDLIVISGLQCVLAVADADRPRFLGKTLDFRVGQFVID